MHCLYCDRPLALLKRLTGDADFCSKEHRTIYEREHNQLALERLLETKPGSNKKPSFRKPEPQAPIAAPVVPPPPPPKPPERIPELADFVAFTYPDEVSMSAEVSQPVGDPIYIELLPDWKEVIGGAGSNGLGGQPRTALFQSDTFDPRAFAASARGSKIFGVKPKRGLPPAPTDLEGPKFRPEAFLDGVVDPKAIDSAIRSALVEPRWKSMQPAFPAVGAGAIVLVTGSFLRWPVVPAVIEDSIPDSFEIRPQPMSFPPFSPRMACLEERLHRTDRIGFTPP